MPNEIAKGDPPLPQAVAEPAPSPAPTGADGFAIVGIGASAGGLAAFSEFFDGMPNDQDTGMAFVLVQHLAPDHKSILTELIQRNTRMQVFEVEDGMQVQVNCAYIIPPNRDMAFLGGALHLLEPSAARGHRLPIDYFFRSLAQDQRERAIGIVLSGTGSDGTAGLRAIKSEGGMVMAQLPESSAFDGMPQSAVATGLVDYTLAPADMPAQLMRYVAQAFGNLPQANAGLANSGAVVHSESALKKIFILLRTQTGHDFSNYKPSTICRRIERRMAVHQIKAIDDYVRFLQQTPLEVESLFRDLLIGVTCFFRDPESFAVLAQRVIPKLFENKAPGAAVRVWSTGCSTGEEGYSIAILLHEHMETLKQNYQLQVFASDIDSRAISYARAGVFPASIASDITPERLARFFTIDPDGASYRINKAIRDMLIFSEHNVIKNPPFSKLDLVTCRNLLIYLNSELQKKLISLFHYALNPGGILFLGTSETAGDSTELFAVFDRKSKLYQRNEDFQGAKRAALERILPIVGSSSRPAKSDTAMPAPNKPFQRAKLSLRELTEQALLQYGELAGALINGFGDILYLHGRTGMFLEPSAGEAGINNILKMAREGLRGELSRCLHQATSGKDQVSAMGLRVKTNGHHTLVNVAVCKLEVSQGAALPDNVIQHTPIRHATPLYLVMLKAVSAVGEAEAIDAEQAQAGDSNSPSTLWRGKDASGQIAELHEALRAKDEFLLAAKEALETSNEELKSSNEEMQSVNEELQSTNEELETSKEELQSINEELSTVNTELQSKVHDLSRVNNDMNNLLAGTGIGTVFVDHALRIMRFTPAATEMINLIPNDIGRHVGHIMSNMIGYDSLVSDIQGVLKTLIAKEIDVQIKPIETSDAAKPNAAKLVESKHYTLRILPYRTLENVIEGAVITFVETTEVVRAREALRKANDLLRLAVVVRDASDAILVQDLSGRITAWNPGAVRMYGWTEAEALQMNTKDRIPKALRDNALAQVEQLSRAQIIEPYLTERLTKNGSTLRISLTSTALVQPDGHVYAIASTERSTEAANL